MQIDLKFNNKLYEQYDITGDNAKILKGNIDITIYYHEVCDCI